MNSTAVSLSEQEISNLLNDAQNGDQQAIETLIHFFEPELKKLTWFIRMPQEDSLQSLKLALVEMIQKSLI